MFSRSPTLIRQSWTPSLSLRGFSTRNVQPHHVFSNDRASAGSAGRVPQRIATAEARRGTLPDRPQSTGPLRMVDGNQISDLRYRASTALLETQRAADARA